MVMFGAVWQQGLIPLPLDAIAQAIHLNGAGPEQNLRAFNLGRWAMLYRDEVQAILTPQQADPVDPVAYRAGLLRAYGGEALETRFLKLVESAPDPLRESVARSYYKLLAIKDEYEVARLHLESMAKAQAEFEGELRPTFHLAPPLLPGTDGQGRPKKRAFGPWIIPVFRLLVKMTPLRWTAFDPFGYSAERKLERALIADFEADMGDIFGSYRLANQSLAQQIVELPLSIRGFGPVKHANAEKAALRRAELLAAWRNEGGSAAAAAE
jgi:indolepyruvate ferredoxin oxidoreductase